MALAQLRMDANWAKATICFDVVPDLKVRVIGTSEFAKGLNLSIHDRDLLSGEKLTIFRLLVVAATKETVAILFICTLAFIRKK